MRNLAIVLTALIFATNLFAQEILIEDTSENRLTEANRYMSVTPPKELLVNLVQKMSAQIPEEKQKAFNDLMLKNIDSDKFSKIIRDSMVNNFTAQDLRALADFYGSPVGKSAMAKFGNYMTEAMPQLQVLMIEASQKTQNQLQD